MLASPANTKLVWPLEVAEVLLLAIEPGRNSIQGTATCFPPAEVEVLGELLVVADVALEAVELVSEEVLDGEPLVADPAEAFTETRAKSIRPECGLIITSLIVPSSALELLVTWAPVSWLARMS